LSWFDIFWFNYYRRGWIILLTSYYILLYNYIFQEFLTLLNLHELTPFFSPSLLRKEGEGPEEQSIVTPLFAEQRGGRGGEFMGKVILLGAIPFCTEGLLNDYLMTT